MKTIITFWPHGYAHEDGLSMIGVEGPVTPAEAGSILGQCGHPLAKVWGLQHITVSGERHPPRPPSVSAEDAAYYRAGDNS